MIQNNKNLWAHVALWILVIYVSIPVARPLTDFLIKHLPFGNIVTTIAAVFFILVFWFIVSRVSLRNLASFFSLAALTFAYAYMLVTIKIPAEKIHFLEYGVLSFLTFRALQKTQRALPCYILSLILTSLVGWADEGLQYLTPGRYYDVRDVIFNAIGGVLGLIFVFILKSGGRKDLKIL